MTIFEFDTVIGKKHKKALLDGKEAKSSTRAVIEKLTPNEPRENSVYLLFSNAVLPVLRPE